MYKRLIDDFVRTQIKKGISLDKIRSYLLKCGYEADDIDEIMRDYEIKEEELAVRSSKVRSSESLLKALSVLLVVLIVGNFIFFYMTNTQFREGTPTAAVVADEEYLKEVCEEYLKKGNITGNIKR